ncbi:GMC family oxidoreductase N-terminal domain-containing protein [Natrinema salsiterrestre]|uniref:GMC family oxidoreductase N-terminal domain-containing protein n=1 Tax=Natrinema salsiterrestre TaxID=2950540 RepID=A0A9Q4L621_9EURY|nr:GMC family oxidoreductase N-terminal domain-containing protein [Natrinema salsiterrestre]MDF9748209.1 GMC family oxidoreductase N-terminal domain-containing protein [Natrinema salsiterrestre]
MNDPDVVVIGAGADGPATASRLARKHGLDVLILEGGPWHGNEQWPEPHADAGGTVSTDPDDLDGKLLDDQFTHREADANDPTHGYLRVGPADHSRAPWFRNLHQNAFIWQVGAVGGTSLHYFANHPRAYPYAIDEQDHWPISYEDLVPYYQLNEEVTSTQQAPMTAKEEVFIEGATNAGYPRLDTKNVTETGWRPQANAVAVPGEETATDQPLDSDYEGSFSYDDGFRGDTLVGDHFQGSSTPVDAPVREKARKSANVSWVPRALDTNDEPEPGNVAIRPNAFVTNIEAEEGLGTMEATGVTFRDSWSGSSQTVSADVVVLAAGCIESPRLWLNSGLPDDGWVGKGLTTHWFDWVVGVYDDDTVAEINPENEHMDPYVGQNSAVRFDKPGVGGMEDIGMSPGLVSYADYLFTEAGYSFDTPVDPGEPWDTRGYVVGEELKRRMSDYRQTKALLILTDDLPRQDNGVSLDNTFSDEHGPVPKVKYEPHPDDDAKRDELARIAANIHREAGAEHVHRCEWPPLLLHMQSTMRMGEVLDENAEAKNVSRLFVADHSAMANGVGGPNPTNTGQALALRTADRIGDLYF